MSKAWAPPVADILTQLGASATGLAAEEAARRLAARPGRQRQRRWRQVVRLLLAQFSSPIVLILLFSAGLSLFLADRTDACMILAIMLVSGGLGFWQEFHAANAVARLLQLIAIKSQVFRDGRPVAVAVAEVVEGDVIQLSAGSTVPADCRVLEAKDLFLNESALTGETFPVEKRPGALPDATELRDRTNLLHQGTHVVSGEGRAVAFAVGADTELGRIAQRLQQSPPETEFERGVRRFGYFLMEVTVVLLLGIFAVHLFQRHPAVDAFLFALALAVGLTPQLLPAIIAVNLAHGARRLAQRDVIVRRLSSIENFGSMDVLCSDKTGTLTTGQVAVRSAVDAHGGDSPRTLELARINAALETGFVNPIDEALRQVADPPVTVPEKLDEIPYDFVRRRLSVLVQEGDQRRLVTKGAVDNVLAACTRVATADGEAPLAPWRAQIDAQFHQLSSSGWRVLAVASRLVDELRVTRAHEADLVFHGLIAFYDPPKPAIEDTVARLRGLGVRLKIVTGDNHLVAAEVARQVGLDGGRLLRGAELLNMSDESLRRRVSDIDVFAEVQPHHKERVIVALRRAGHVVGYLGDGINDATALHAADVGISVDQAVDVAKEAADIVLLQPDLDVLSAGVEEGRATFANTLKYVFMATSANFGNMFSMAGASVFLTFLPLLPKQILLMNLLTDIPEMTIAQDRVDPELACRPRRWNLRLIQRFMIVFGALSSVFDFLTFAVLLRGLKVDEAGFRTGWFVESVISAATVVLVVRTRRPFWRSPPGSAMIGATALVALVALVLPATELGANLGFETLSPSTCAAMLSIVALYAAAAEATKAWFYRTFHEP